MLWPAACGQQGGGGKQALLQGVQAFAQQAGIRQGLAGHDKAQVVAAAQRVGLIADDIHLDVQVRMRLHDVAQHRAQVQAGELVGRGNAQCAPEWCFRLALQVVGHIFQPGKQGLISSSR
jgi:hypothetical protein